MFLQKFLKYFQKMCKELINKRFINIVNSVLESKKASSKADVCQKFRISPQKFSEILKERMNVGTDLLAYVAELYPEYSLRWLLTGEGSMLESDENSEDKASGSTKLSEKEAFSVLLEQVKQLSADNALLKAELERLKAGTGNALNVATA